MLSDSIVIVLLRRPGKSDRRDDPFWEFGSFGLTGCHKDNLLHRRSARELNGVRLAFAQGGRHGFKLVFLTPPVCIVEHRDCCEATWRPARKPFRYDSAPVLVANHGEKIRGMEKALSGVSRSTYEARFSSRFRTRSTPLNDDFPELAEQIAAQFEPAYATAKRNGTLAKTYDQALPWAIKNPDREREHTYNEKLDKCGGVLAKEVRHPCGSKKRC